MPERTLEEQTILRDLGRGLIMRRARSEDAEKLADFQAHMHADPGGPEVDEGVRAWMLDLMAGANPTFQPGDFLIVEDRHSGEIASSLCLISHTLTFGGVPFKAGQPELVATAPAYRRLGLVRAQFEVIHRWSEERGQMAQIITGIPWYYRQFDYEMALPMHGFRTGYRGNVPALAQGTPEPYLLRPASNSDIPFMRQMYEQFSKRSLVAAPRDDALWRRELHGHRERNLMRNEVRIIETPDGQPVGMLVHKPNLWGPALVCILYEVKPGVSWATATPTVVRYLASTGEEYARRDGGAWEAFTLSLGSEHPVYLVIKDRLPRTRSPYAWYVRVPGVPGFVRHVAPVLEDRIANSPLSGYSEEIRLNFYRSGLHVGFENGKLSVSEPWRPDHANDGNAAFPDLTFLQLLFGRLTLDELEAVFPDCWANGDDIRALLTVLFPKLPTNLWPVG